MQVKALAFDVFGTIVDWRTSVIREGELLGQRLGLQADWAQFADDWRAGYVPAMQRVTSGAVAWQTIDQLHRSILDDLCIRHALTLSDSDRADFNRVWHRLMPWPDSVGGLNRLRNKFVLATLSNGNVSLLVDMARNAGLPWDCILSAELFGQYKPALNVYRSAAKLLDIAPDEVLMVAAHTSDLEAAKAAGLRTAYIHRAHEFGPMRPKALPSADRFDVIAMDCYDLARQLGA